MYAILCSGGGNGFFEKGFDFWKSWVVYCKNKSFLFRILLKANYIPFYFEVISKSLVSVVKLWLFVFASQKFTYAYRSIMLYTLSLVKFVNKKYFLKLPNQSISIYFYLFPLLFFRYWTIPIHWSWCIASRMGQPAMSRSLFVCTNKPNERYIVANLCTLFVCSKICLVVFCN